MLRTLLQILAHQSAREPSIGTQPQLLSAHRLSAEQEPEATHRLQLLAEQSEAGHREVCRCYIEGASCMGGQDITEDVSQHGGFVVDDVGDAHSRNSCRLPALFKRILQMVAIPRRNLAADLAVPRRVVNAAIIRDEDP